MAVAEKMGHDHTGKEIYRWDMVKKRMDINLIWDDIPLIIDEFKRSANEKYTFFISQELATKKEIYVPRYYWQAKDKEISKVALKTNCTLISINQLTKENIIWFFDGHGSPPSEFKGTGDVPYIRVKDIVNWEIYKDPTSKILRELFLKMVRDNKKLQSTDVVYVRRGSYRIGSVAMVSPYDLEAVLTREILVLRVVEQNNRYGLNPYYLLYLLSHMLVVEQTRNKVLIETTLPNIGGRWKELNLPISNSESERKRITTLVKEAIDYKWLAVEKIKKMKEEFGELIT